jgi:DNA-binding transcriptional ArsR family regulator
MICSAPATNSLASPAMSSAFPIELEQKVLHLCRMMADPQRLKILTMLCREPELHVSALCQRLQQSQPAVSHHLALMKDMGLLEMRREGKHNFYFIPSHVHQLVQQLFAAVDDTALTPASSAIPSGE